MALLDADAATKTLDPERENHLLSEVSHRPQAFRKLYGYYFPRVYAYVAYRVGTVQDAEDLVSETFLKVIEKLDTFHYRGEGSFAAWLFRIAHNLVSDFYWRCGRRGDAVSLVALSQLQDDCSVVVAMGFRVSGVSAWIYAELDPLVGGATGRRAAVPAARTPEHLLNDAAIAWRGKGWRICRLLPRRVTIREEGRPPQRSVSLFRNQLERPGVEAAFHEFHVLEAGAG